MKALLVLLLLVLCAAAAADTRRTVVEPGSVDAPDVGRSPQPMFWCYSDRDGFANCGDDKSECIDSQVRVSGCRVDSTLLYCLQAYAVVEGMTTCAPQRRASCFGMHNVLQDHAASVCAPTITSCRKRRAAIFGDNLKEDYKVTTECMPVRLETFQP